MINDHNGYYEVNNKPYLLAEIILQQGSPRHLGIFNRLIKPSMPTAKGVLHDCRAAYAMLPMYKPKLAILLAMAAYEEEQDILASMKHLNPRAENPSLLDVFSDIMQVTKLPLGRSFITCFSQKPPNKEEVLKLLDTQWPTENYPQVISALFEACNTPMGNYQNIAINNDLRAAALCLAKYLGYPEITQCRLAHFFERYAFCESLP